jgi:hypothetical protein
MHQVCCYLDFNLPRKYLNIVNLDLIATLPK